MRRRRPGLPGRRFGVAAPRARCDAPPVRARSIPALFVLLLAACGPEHAPSTTFATATLPSSAGSDPTSPTSFTTTPTSGDSSSVGDATTAVDPTSGADPSLPDTITATVTTEVVTSEGPSSDPSSATEFTTVDPNCADAPGQPQDSACTDPSGCGCASGHCFVIPLFNGFCSECLGDADCKGGGCTHPNPVALTGAVCNNGEPGAGCESDAVCADPKHALCGEVLDIPGIITVSTCGACETNAQCPGNAPNCSPAYDLPNFTGVFECVPNKSLADGEGCSLIPDNNDDPIGNQACKSGLCGAADVMGILKLGVCGECISDADCAKFGLDTCSPAQADTNSGVLTPATCA